MLFGDGHCEWTNSPLVGVNHDNIYAPGVEGDSVIAAAVNGNDSILLPTAEQDAQKETTKPSE